MSERQYPQLSPHIDLPATERQVLEFWDSNEIFAKSLSSRESGEPWTFFEGPPTANGMPGTHHIEARVFKDVFPRFHTMKGRFVRRKAGWDCHGLPVEIAVEKELGFAGKGDIEKFGIAEFNAKCRESVQRHVGAFTDMTKRMGFWVDFDQAYWTMSPEYVESIWWSLKEIWKKGLLGEDHRVAPYCPRCGTGLSDHELAQGYETVTDPSVYVRFPATSGKLAELGAKFLVWTTTPWTLVSNTAVAVNPDVEYLVVERIEDGERLVIASDLAHVAGEHKEVARYKGAELERISYSRPFDLVDIPDSHYIVLGEYVTVEDGTGLVHQSPAFGADDLAVCRRYGLPVVNPVRGDGTFDSALPLIGGQFFKEADKALVKDLKSRNLLFKHLPYEHSYPHCWRCHTPLIYYAQPSWYIRTTQIKDALLRENAATDWHPETIKNGRYGDWLDNNIDWALSRNRFWGTPLPIWRCESGDRSHDICIGSLRELGELAGRDLSSMDPHRPYVDDISFKCGACQNEMKRVPEVIDVWYDSGAMPFAQWGYPHTEGSHEIFDSAYPADFICEAIDQTRGWFYTLMAIGTLVFDRSSYRSVLCLGHILDKDGRKMSKHLGNVLEPMSLMDQHGADAVRWFMLAAGSPWSARRVGHELITEVVRKTLLTYWNTVSFQTLYARAAGFTPSRSGAAPESEHLLDRWIISELNMLIASVDEALSRFDSQESGRVIAEFIDQLSNWYVRRSRRRFWDGNPQALETLHYCLEKVTLLMAPMVPFITEHVWQNLIRSVSLKAPESVHLADFPVVDRSLIDSELSSQVALTRRLVELGRAARAESSVKIRQPLSRILISAPGWQALPNELRDQISDELNVIALDDLSVVGDLVDVTVKANFRPLGAKYGAAVQSIARAIQSENASQLVKDVRTSGKVAIEYSSSDGGIVTADLTLDDLVITETPREGWTFASAHGESVALDLTLDDNLIARGIAREAIRLIQDERKALGFDISDRITMVWNAGEEFIAAISAYSAHIGEEVLALGISRDTTLPLGENELGLALRLTK
ncbi:MAG: isoleucine--tRNA ligase [Candidatus Nanopelagicaceae bacterium]